MIRPGLVAELESFRAPDRRVSSYYLNLNPQPPGNGEAVRIALKNALAQERERIDQLDVRACGAPCPAPRLGAGGGSWRRPSIGERHTLALACFVASDAGYGRAVRLPWPVRHRAFFEDRFVLWPLRQVLDQADRYAIILTDKEDARLFLFFLERIEEVADIRDAVPGRVRFPDPFGESHYMHKHVEHFHHHFEHVAEAALRLYEREPFEHLIIGGRWETLPQFEGHLHRYLRDRIVARWEIDVRTPTPQIQERAMQEEQQFLDARPGTSGRPSRTSGRSAGRWGRKRCSPPCGSGGSRRLLVDPDVARPGFRCSVCGRLQPERRPVRRVRRPDGRGRPTSWKRRSTTPSSRRARCATGRTRPWQRPIPSRRPTVLTGRVQLAAQERFLIAARPLAGWPGSARPTVPEGVPVQANPPSPHFNAHAFQATVLPAGGGRRAVRGRKVLDGRLALRRLGEQRHQLVEVGRHVAVDGQTQLLRLAQADRMVVRPGPLRQPVCQDRGLVRGHRVGEQLHHFRPDLPHGFLCHVGQDERLVVRSRLCPWS